MPEKPTAPELSELSFGLSGYSLTDYGTPKADEPCVLYYKAGGSFPFGGFTAPLYVHIGIIAHEWTYVQADWNTNLEKCRLIPTDETDVWKLEITPTIRQWFGAAADEVINKIGVVVRNADGTKQTKDLFCSVEDDANEVTYDKVEKAPLPAGVVPGINYIDDSTVTLVLKEQDTDGECYDYAYVIGDHSDWECQSAYVMKRDEEAGCWWCTLEGLTPGKEYRFQYHLYDEAWGTIRIADPYTEVVYTTDDKWISSTTYPDMPTYPTKTSGNVAAFQTQRAPYDWAVKEFEVGDADDLIIYELLLRDFSTTKDLKGAWTKLDYLEELGIDAIELMPTQEFDGNLSWGYNPNHYFAMDKAYGTRQMYKDFVDECHRRGIAVIVDVVYNHLTGLSTYAKLYYEGDKTAAVNPWFNVDAPHPYSVFHDINHENDLISQHIKESLAYLIREYDVDGFRFDLTKGFTNKKSNESSASNYDASRIAILKRYHNYIMSVKSDAVVILEHFCEEKEEKELVQAGMKVWRNCNGAYRGAALGAAGDFSGIWTGNSTVPFGGYVGFMESHDEERVCYGAVSDVTSVTWGICGTMTDWSSDLKMSADGPFFVAKNVTCSATERFKIRGNASWDDAYNYGAASDNFKLTVGSAYVMTVGSGSKDMFVPAAGTYDIYFCPEIKTIWLMNTGERPDEPEIEKETEDAFEVAMRRAGCNAAFCFTVPGPKMIWQFGEIGYDVSIEYNGRTGEKPVLTDSYMADPARKALYDTYAALIGFRRDNPRFFDQDAKFEWTPSATVKTIRCSVDGKSFCVIGNFDTLSQNVSLPEGTWKDYISGETLSGTVKLKQGEFRLLVDF